MRKSERTRNHVRLLFSFVVMVSVSAGGLFAQPIVSDFEGPTDDGWTIDGNFGSTTPDVNAAGGNPMAYISDLDEGAGLWYYDSPAKFTGNLTAYIGETLFWDLNQDLAVDLASPHLNAVIIEGGGSSLYHRLPNNPGVGAWQTESVILDETGTWFVGSDAGPAAMAGDFATVFANVTRLRIRGDYNTTLETTGLDNVIMTPVELQSFSID